MTVWLVGVCDCEGNEIEAVCATKEIAERELFKVRDWLVAEWEKSEEWSVKSRKEFCEKEGKEYWHDDMYTNMIKNLSGNDYDKWVNYPHDCPYLYSVEVLTA